MRAISGSESRRLHRGEPQVRQKQRFFPGEDSNSATDSAPVTRRKYFVRTGAFVTNAPPCALRQVTQWQWPKQGQSCRRFRTGPHRKGNSRSTWCRSSLLARLNA
jgi:hypothetical protein